MEALNPAPPMILALTKTYKFTDYMKHSSPEIQLLHTLPGLCRLLNKYCVSFYIYPELTLHNQIHYHGVLYVSDEYGYHKFLYPKLIRSGFCVIKPVGNFKKWEKYCQKSLSYTRRLFKINTGCINKNSYKEVIKKLKKKEYDVPHPDGICL